MENEKEIQQFKNRLRDLADKSYQQDIFTYSNFLNMAEIDIYCQLERELSYAHPTLYGGHEAFERAILRFGDADASGYDPGFPVQCIYIKPATPKFAEALTHRDFLGALMNLGIERQTLGDIIVNEKEAWVFVLDKISEYICDNLTKVRHNNVKCIPVENADLLPKSVTEDVTIQVASLRLDAVIAKVHHLSRETSLELFRASKVYVNGRLTENNSMSLRGGESISVRGFGKFVVGEDSHTTKKGRLAVTVTVYR